MSQQGDCSHHARVRMQQRGITEESLDLLMQYGRSSYDHKGHVLIHMDKSLVRAAVRDGLRTAIDRVRGLYAVVGTDGVVVTVGHRYRRLRRA
jgi:hypothetical protein